MDWMCFVTPFSCPRALLRLSVAERRGGWLPAGPFPPDGEEREPNCGSVITSLCNLCVCPEMRLMITFPETATAACVVRGRAREVPAPGAGENQRAAAVPPLHNKAAMAQQLRTRAFPCRDACQNVVIYSCFRAWSVPSAGLEPSGRRFPRPPSWEGGGRKCFNYFTS